MRNALRLHGEGAISCKFLRCEWHSFKGRRILRKGSHRVRPPETSSLSFRLLSRIIKWKSRHLQAKETAVIFTMALRAYDRNFYRVPSVKGYCELSDKMKLLEAPLIIVV